MENHEESNKKESGFRSYLKTIKDFIYGFTVYELHVEHRREKGYLERLFMLIVFGDLLGLPLFPPYYTLRILPFVVPSIKKWKMSVLRERDITDLAARDL